MERIDLDRARRDAKALLRAARAGEVVLRADRAPVLADGPRAGAVELGFASWPALVLGVRGSALLAAAGAGRAEEVYRLLVDGAPANARDAAGRTAPPLAAGGGGGGGVGGGGGGGGGRRGRRLGAGRPRRARRRRPRALERRPRRGEDPRAARAAGRGRRARRAGGAGPRRGEPPAEAAPRGELAWRADAALFSLLAGSPAASRRAVGDGFAFRTGLRDNTRNGIVCSRVEDV